MARLRSMRCEALESVESLVGERDEILKWVKKGSRPRNEFPKPRLGM